MKLLFFTCALFASLACAQPPTASPAQIKEWFPPEQLMTIGVYYYPEAWPESQWERDFSNIKKFGFEYVHMGEFAWAFMEPQEGKYDFGWLDRAVEIGDAKWLIIRRNLHPLRRAVISEMFPLSRIHL